MTDQEQQPQMTDQQRREWEQYQQWQAQQEGASPPPMPPKKGWTTKKKIGVGAIGLVVALMALGVARGPQPTGTNPARSPVAAAPARPTPTPSLEYKLAALHGDPSAEPEFRRVLDQIQRGGSVCRPEPDRQRASDVMYAGWDNAGKPGTLLEWAQSLAALCR